MVLSARHISIKIIASGPIVPGGTTKQIVELLRRCYQAPLLLVDKLYVTPRQLKLITIQISYGIALYRL